MSVKVLQLRMGYQNLVIIVAIIRGLVLANQEAVLNQLVGLVQELNGILVDPSIKIKALSTVVVKKE